MMNPQTTSENIYLKKRFFQTTFFFGKDETWNKGRARGLDSDNISSSLARWGGKSLHYGPLKPHGF